MNRPSRLFSFVFLSAWLIPSPGSADLLSDAKSAYESGSYEDAVRLLDQAASEGNAEAQYSLGIMYEHGRGVSKDEVKAVEWYLKSAMQGNAAAQNNLGY